MNNTLKATTVFVAVIVAMTLAITMPAFSAEVVGGGQIGDPITDTTIPSPSDFGIAATDDGGTFVCSMAGPVTGGFRFADHNHELMTVEGRVVPNSLEIGDDGTATFLADVEVVYVDEGTNVVHYAGARPGPYARILVTLGAGGPDEGYFIMSDPDFRPLLGLPGRTGGYLKTGRLIIIDK